MTTMAAVRQALQRCSARRRVADRGAASLEYVGVVILVTVVAGVLAVSGLPQVVAQMVSCKVAEANGGGGCGGGATQTATGGAGGPGTVVAGTSTGDGAASGGGTGPSREDEARNARGDRRSSQDRRYEPPTAPTSGTGGPAPSGDPLGAPVPGTSAPVPSPPVWRAADEGAGAHASESAGIKDRAVEFAAEGAANAMGRTWPHASRNLLHFLDNSGTPLQQDVDALLEDVPALHEQVDSQRTNLAQAAVERARALGGKGPVTFPLSTAWQGFYISPDLSKDWFYALGGVSWNLTGTVTVYPPSTPGGPWRYVMKTRVELRDRYNWDGGKSTEIGPFTVTDEQLAELHRKGLAQEFDATGSSSTATTEGDVP